VKFKTQKLVFFAVAAASCLLLTCSPFAAGDYDESGGGGITYTDVEYSPDGRSITVYLDGSKPVRQSRALNLDNAKYGHDLFEVAFYRSEAGRVTIARAVWEKGHAAGVNGVVRNVDYRYADIPSITSNPVPGVNLGAAIIFVGKKSDKTLLAVGKLTGTSDGGPLATLVTENTRSVTFLVAAFDSGTSFSAAGPTFFTAAKQDIGVSPGPGVGTPLTTANETNTDVVPIMFGRFLFPLYRLNKQLITDNQVISAIYKFDVYNAVFSDFHGGILQYAPPSLAMMEYTIPSSDVAIPLTDHLRPRYPRGGGQWEYGILADRDDGPLGVPPGTGLTIGSGTNGQPFQNPVQFTFTSRIGMDGCVFAFSFQVPVFPLTDLDERGLRDPWFLRPGFDSHWYDLDNGVGGNGGAILIGTGDIEQSLSYNLSVRPPQKTIYPSIGPGDAVGDEWKLNLKNILVNLHAGGGNLNFVAETLFSRPSDGNDVTNPAVKFFIGSTEVHEYDDPITIMNILTIPNPSPPPARAPNPAVVDSAGMVDVRVEYFDGSTTYFGEFTIFLWLDGPIPNSDAILPQNRRIIASSNDLLYFSNTPLTSGNYLLVLFDSIDLTQITLNGSCFFIIVAARPDVVIGRADANAVFQVNGGGNASTFYLGVWPFNDSLEAEGVAIKSYPLTINAGGSCLPPYSDTHGAGYFINSQSNSVTVTRGPGLIVHNNGRFSNVYGL
jgi:hypothetical protein